MHQWNSNHLRLLLMLSPSTLKCEVEYLHTFALHMEVWQCGLVVSYYLWVKYILGQGYKFVSHLTIEVKHNISQNVLINSWLLHSSHDYGSWCHVKKQLWLMVACEATFQEYCTLAMVNTALHIQPVLFPALSTRVHINYKIWSFAEAFLISISIFMLKTYILYQSQAEHISQVVRSQVMGHPS